MITILMQERIKNNLTREQLAKKIGISSEAIRLLETGKRKPSYDVLVKLLNLFGYKDPRELFKKVPETSQSKDILKETSPKNNN